MRTGSGLANEVEDSVAIVGPVGDDVTMGRQVFQEFGDRPLIMCLSRGQNDANWQAVIIHHSVDLGAQSSTRQTDGVILTRFFLPPAACW